MDDLFHSLPSMGQGPQAGGRPTVATPELQGSAFFAAFDTLALAKEADATGDLALDVDVSNATTIDSKVQGIGADGSLSQPLPLTTTNIAINAQLAKATPGDPNRTLTQSLPLGAPLDAPPGFPQPDLPQMAIPLPEGSVAQGINTAGPLDKIPPSFQPATSAVLNPADEVMDLAHDNGGSRQTFPTSPLVADPDGARPDQTGPQVLRPGDRYLPQAPAQQAPTPHSTGREKPPHETTVQPIAKGPSAPPHAMDPGGMHIAPSTSPVADPGVGRADTTIRPKPAPSNQPRANAAAGAPPIPGVREALSSQSTVPMNLPTDADRVGSLPFINSAEARPTPIAPQSMSLLTASLGLPSQSFPPPHVAGTVDLGRSAKPPSDTNAPNTPTPGVGAATPLSTAGPNVTDASSLKVPLTQPSFHLATSAPSNTLPDKAGHRDGAPTRTGAWTVGPSSQPASIFQPPQIGGAKPVAMGSHTLSQPVKDAISDLDFSVQATSSALSTTALTSPQAVFGQPPSPTAHSIAHQIAAALAHPSADKGAPLELALDPPELGRVRMQISEVAGAMTLMIHAERPETADLMRRHLELLAQEFAQAGLGAPSVHIRQDTAGHGGGATGRDTRDTPPILAAELDTSDPIPLPQRSAVGGLDLRL